MNKIGIIKDYLTKLYPIVECELKYDSTFQLLIAVMLSAQTTDRKVNSVTKVLFDKYERIEDLACADQNEIKDIIHSLGLSNIKSKNIIAISRIILDEYNGIVPTDFNHLTKLPGIGKKTALVVRAVGFNIPEFPVDTHVSRIAKRLGLVSNRENVDLINKELMKLFEKEDWISMHHRFIHFGRYKCKAVNPACEDCVLRKICDYQKE